MITNQSIKFYLIGQLNLNRSNFCINDDQLERDSDWDQAFNSRLGGIKHVNI